MTASQPWSQLGGQTRRVETRIDIEIIAPGNALSHCNPGARLAGRQDKLGPVRDKQ
uniref:Uncharacterized protein n=1 Tax=Timema shepardi TaxID=629360 RepID=A0A7R9G654_TIMSH|nr:unnamed protein product [Timema shepardi]